MHEIRNGILKRPTFYLDETWVNQNHSKSMIWQDPEERGGLKVPVGKGGRLIVLHAGSAETGFVKECKLIFHAQKSSLNTDYHNEMNSKLFKEWFVNFLYLLEESSVIVMDNASYHSALAEKAPKSNWRKLGIQEWLRNHKIEFSMQDTRAQLLNKNEIKNALKIYEIDQISLRNGS